MILRERGLKFLPMLALLLGLFGAWFLASQFSGTKSLSFEFPGEGTTLRLARPQSLWLMPVALLPYLTLVALRTLIDLRPLQIILQLATRIFLLMAIALALALPTIETPVHGKSIVFVVDVSASIDERQREAVRRLVARGRSLAASQEHTIFRLVSYAARAKIVDLEGVRIQDLFQVEDTDDRLASNHAAGLRLGAALLQSQQEARMVLVTDGTGDSGEREALAQTIHALEARGVTVHTRSFPAAAHADIFIEAVHLPDDLRTGQSFDVVVDVVSTTPQVAVHIAMDKNDAPNSLAPNRAVTLREGRQQIKFPARATRSGPIIFRATLDSQGIPGDLNRSLRNDTAAAVGDVRGRPKVLFVGRNTNAAVPRALRADHLDVQQISAVDLPVQADELSPFDLVIFSDIARATVSNERQRALVHYVEQTGGGFIMIGGESSFGVGGWGGSQIESILPVRYSGKVQREQPTLALMLVIDKSGSMSGQGRLGLVKEAARATSRTLDPSDELGIVAFDSRPQVLVRLQPAANRLRIASSIRRLSSGGGTHALPALREAYLQLTGSKALIKHVILLSDGESPNAGVDTLLANMREADITISSVGVGSGAGKGFLAHVAKLGNGRYYFSQDGTDVPRIFSRETREITRNSVVERLLFPKVAKPVQALRGIDFSTAPGLRGLIPLKAKAGSEVLLRTHLGDPLLIRGRTGLGRVVAFASDAKPRWAAHWLTWRSFAKFWSQVARDTMRQGSGRLGGATLLVRPALKAGSWKVVVDVESPRGFSNDLDGSVEVIDLGLSNDSDHETTHVPLSLVAPGRYEAVLDGVTTGHRLLRAKLYDEQQRPRRLRAEASAQIAIPYPAELAPMQLKAQHDWLASIPAGASTAGEIDAIIQTPADSSEQTHSKPLWSKVVLLLVLPAMLLDLFLRRISFGLRRLKA